MLLYLMILEKDDNLVQSNTIIANNQIITLLFYKNSEIYNEIAFVQQFGKILHRKMHFRR
ncbi:hypothetical protein CGL57_01725 [Edwardsiella anguillarum]|nr:hypothetical protein QY76_11630 [Edwardsiella sp. EA181011]RFT05254.1 hypothetical protein CGL57_01725 [Edwardsiella anguillarum]